MTTGNSNIPQSPTCPTLVDDASISDSTLQPPPSSSNPAQSPTCPTLVAAASISNSTLEPPPPSSTSNRPNLYPKIETNNEEIPDYAPSAPPECIEETVLTIRGAIVHLIDKQCSVELATGDLSILQLRQGNNTLAIFARVDDEIQWPLTKDLAAVKLDYCHYFFSFPSPKEIDSDSDSDSPSEEEINQKHKKKVQKEKNSSKKAATDAEKVVPPLDVLNYGLTIASKGQETLLNEFDKILENSSSFSVHKLKNDIVKELLGGESTNEMSPEDLNVEGKKEILEGKCAAYWTTLAPNVEEYSGAAAKLVAMGSGQLIKGILWCGDVAADRLRWGNETLKKKLASGGNAEISPETLKRIKRVKRITRMTENVATGVLTGVIAVSGYFTGTVVNSSVGKKFFNLLPGEVVLASLDGFSKICDAVEIAGKNVMSTSSTVTTGLVSHRYGEEAAKATSEGLDAAGHAIGTAWAAFKIRKAFNPKSALKPGTLTKAAAKAAEKKTKNSK